METPNLSYIQNMSGGNLEFEKKIIAIIKEEFPEERQTYFNHFNSKDLKKTVEIVHKIKHKISILGLENRYQLAASFEANLLSGHTDLNEDFELTLSMISDFLKQI